MASKTVKQIIRAAIGALYAVVYGIWTMLATGGGHGNFVWFIMFLYVEFFGLYFPIMAVLSGDLRSRTNKIVFGSLILFNLIASIVLIGSWVSGISGESLDVFDKMWERGSGSILVCAVVHFLPTVFFTFQLINALYYGSDSIVEDPIVTLHLD